ncbi:MAG TPA: YCF48-related protein [Pyrinomonadaceae bacterium]|nr:YCF48-related protein [Pyrinomonadaceae bacterium]
MNSIRIKTNSVRRIKTTSLSCCLLLLIASLQINAQTPGWAKQPVGTLAWLHAVFFLNQNRGWIVGSKGTLLATDDGGKSWKTKTATTTDVLRDVYFADEQNGWLVCEKNIYDLKEKDEPRTYLMQTTDGGENWKRINIKGIDVDIVLVRVVFTRGGRGWAFGEAGSIYSTRDSGENWTRLTSPTRHLLLGGMFIDDDRGWLVGAGATIIQTADGGDTWHVTRLPQAIENAVRFSAASFVDNRLGWAVGSRGTIYRTVNGGRTWQMQNSGVLSDLYDVKFLDAMEGWAVGAEGTVIYTNDGGLNWTTQRSDTSHPLERIFFAGRTQGWAVGFGGTVVTYVRTEAPLLHR